MYLHRRLCAIKTSRRQKQIITNREDGTFVHKYTGRVLGDDGANHPNDGANRAKLFNFNRIIPLIIGEFEWERRERRNLHKFLLAIRCLFVAGMEIVLSLSESVGHRGGELQ
jgi:hypothetical protein